MEIKFSDSFSYFQQVLRNFNSYFEFSVTLIFLYINSWLFCGTMDSLWLNREVYFKGIIIFIGEGSCSLGSMTTKWHCDSNWQFLYRLLYIVIIFVTPEPTCH